MSNGRPRKASSVNRSKASLRAFIRFLVDSDYLARDPARLVRYARVPRPTACAMLTADVGRLLKTVGKDHSPVARRDDLMFRLMLGTGIRLGSLVALNDEDVDLKAGTLRIRAKGGGEQSGYLNTALRREVKQHLRTAGGSYAPFRSSRGPRLGTR